MFLILASCKYNKLYLHFNISFSDYNLDGLSTKYMLTKIKDEKDYFLKVNLMHVDMTTFI